MDSYNSAYSIQIYNNYSHNYIYIQEKTYQNMLKQLQINTKTLFLSGISLKGDLYIYNPNPQLSISYQIQPTYIANTNEIENLSQTNNNNKSISIFPRNGLLLKQQKQKITVMIKTSSEFQNQEIFNCTSSICLSIKYHYNNNFNRIYLKSKYRNNKYVHQIQQQPKYMDIKVEISCNNLRIKDQIDSQVMCRLSLAKQLGNISEIKDSRETDQDCSYVCTIIHNLQLNSNIKSKQNSVSQDKKQESQVSKSKTKYKLLQEDNKNIQNQHNKQNEQNKNIQQQNIQFVSAICQQFTKTINYQSFIKQQNKQICNVNKQKMIYKVNSLQLFLLALLAGFFYSLGSNLNYFIYKS